MHISFGGVVGGATCRRPSPSRLLPVPQEAYLRPASCDGWSFDWWAMAFKCVEGTVVWRHAWRFATLDKDTVTKHVSKKLNLSYFRAKTRCGARAVTHTATFVGCWLVLDAALCKRRVTWRLLLSLFGRGYGNGRAWHQPAYAGSAALASSAEAESPLHSPWRPFAQ